MIVIAAICIKLFDKEIRPVMWKKAMVNTAVITGFILIIIGVIQIIIY